MPPMPSLQSQMAPLVPMPPMTPFCMGCDCMGCDCTGFECMGCEMPFPEFPKPLFVFKYATESFEYHSSSSFQEEFNFWWVKLCYSNTIYIYCIFGFHSFIYIHMNSYFHPSVCVCTYINKVLFGAYLFNNNHVSKLSRSGLRSRSQAGKVRIQSITFVSVERSSSNSYQPWP